MNESEAKIRRLAIERREAKSELDRLGATNLSGKTIEEQDQLTGDHAMAEARYFKVSLMLDEAMRQFQNKTP